MAEHHRRALDRVGTLHDIVGVTDVVRPAADAFARRAGTKSFGTVVDMLEMTRPDLVHICTPAGTHVEPARDALRAGAHVYIEKPFVETREDAEELFRVAKEHGRLICAGHQLLADPAYRRLLQDASALRPVTLVTSDFAFRPPRLDPSSSSARALGAQLLDVLPHPLYSLIAALTSLSRTPSQFEVVHVSASPTSLHAVLRSGEVTGRLCVSLRVRPVASTLTIAGAHGSLTADFVRGIVIGAGNEGTSPLEKIINPFIEASQLAWRSATSLVRRLAHGIDYPGLAELLGDFYLAASSGQPSPVSLDHLRSVAIAYEQIAREVRRSADRAIVPPRARAAASAVAPVAVVTGAAGFFGKGICRELVRRGFRVRGVGRGDRPDGVDVHEWVRADLSRELITDVLRGVEVVVHAAAETDGGFEAHERNTVDATRQLLRSMSAARAGRLVYISSISVLRPPGAFSAPQTEVTPLARRAERLGPYTWGKCAAEELVAEAQVRGDIAARIIRPAALVDWEALAFPGLLGRRLFGNWHLGLGRPGLPLAICDVESASAAVAWCARDFTDAPPILNLFDPRFRTRRDVLAAFREHGWRGRVVWAPISLLAGAASVARTIAGLMHGSRARPLAVWSVLRPRAFDPSLSARVLAAAREPVRPVPASPALGVPAVAHVSVMDD